MLQRATKQSNSVCIQSAFPKFINNAQRPATQWAAELHACKQRPCLEDFSKAMIDGPSGSCREPMTETQITSLASRDKHASEISEA